jgi:hypothetical protein
MISYFIFVAFLLPAIASRSGEAGGEESDKLQSPPAKFLSFLI